MIRIIYVYLQDIQFIMWMPIFSLSLKKIIVISRNAVEGLLITFVVNYEFGFSNPEKNGKFFSNFCKDIFCVNYTYFLFLIKMTIFYIYLLYRYIALINPAEGNKNGGKTKKKQSYSPAVYKLARAL